MAETDLLENVAGRQIVENFLKTEILPLDKRITYRGIGLIWGCGLRRFRQRT